MSPTSLFLLVMVGVMLATLIAALVIYRRSPIEPEVRPLVSDPALPEIRERAVGRLLNLPHFRRILDGSLFDYCSGASLRTCTCEALPYPHLILDYGRKRSVVFETAGALEQYVAVQEAIGRLLMGRSALGSTGEGH